MRESLTKEEFLDKKNIQLIKSVAVAMELKSELSVLTSYIERKKKNGLSLCKIVDRKVAGVYPTYYVHDLFVKMIEMIDKGELVFKQDI